MNTSTEIAQNPIELPSFPAQDLSTNGLLLLAGLAIFLVKGLWQEHCEDEKAERELLKTLIDRQSKKQ